MGRKRKGVVVSCPQCGKQKHIPPSWIGKRGKFCSRQCYFKFIQDAKNGHLKHKLK